MGSLIARLKKKSDSLALHGLDTANNIAKAWKYVDFSDPHTGQPCLLLEWVFGSRGLLLGRIMKIEADQGVGKSSFLFALYGMAQVGTNAYCFHLEAENAEQPPDYIHSLGCNPDSLGIAKPGSIERAMAMVEELTNEARKDDPEKKCPIIVGLDSVSGFGSDAAMEDPEDPTALDLTKQNAGLGSHARCLSKWFRDRGGIWLQEKDVFLVMITQLKDKIVTDMGPAKYLTADQKRGTIAEKPLNFSATYRLELKSSPLRDKETKDDIGELVTIKVSKNKLSPKNREVQIPLIREKGFNFTDETVDMLRRFSPINLPNGKQFAIEQRGSFLNYNGENYHSNSESKKQILDKIYGDQALLMGLREALRIRGFGFAFETNYVMSPEEIEDNDAKVAGN